MPAGDGMELPNPFREVGVQESCTETAIGSRPKGPNQGQRYFRSGRENSKINSPETQMQEISVWNELVGPIYENIRQSKSTLAQMLKRWNHLQCCVRLTGSGFQLQ